MFWKVYSAESKLLKFNASKYFENNNEYDRSCSVCMCAVCCVSVGCCELFVFQMNVVHVFSKVCHRLSHLRIQLKQLKINVQENWIKWMFPFCKITK